MPELGRQAAKRRRLAQRCQAAAGQLQQRSRESLQDQTQAMPHCAATALTVTSNAARARMETEDIKVIQNTEKLRIWCKSSQSLKPEARRRLAKNRTKVFYRGHREIHKIIHERIPLTRISCKNFPITPAACLNLHTDPIVSAIVKFDG